jgi:hypothetical protein
MQHPDAHADADGHPVNCADGCRDHPSDGPPLGARCHESGSAEHDDAIPPVDRHGDHDDDAG